MANGFLQEVIKGWYIPSRPDGGAAVDVLKPVEDLQGLGQFLRR
jgi:hypothetical protein